MNDIELRELDAWIAEHVMGWRSITARAFKDNDFAGVPPTASGLHHIVPCYTTDRAAAMEVFEKCIKNAGGYQIQIDGEYHIGWGGSTSKRQVSSRSSTFPLTICLFAKALFTKDHI